MSEKTYTNWGISGSFTGHLGRDPELRFTRTGTAVCNFSVAVDCDVLGQDEPNTTWVRVTCWKEGAEQANEALTKGSLVRIEYYKGHLRKYEGRNGPDASFEVTASEVKTYGDSGWEAVFGKAPRHDPLANNRDEPPPGFEEENDIPF